MAKQIDYDDNLENLLKDEAEKAESLSILHRLSHEKYSLYSNAINIPVIVGSSAVGFMTGIQIDFDDINIILGIFSVVIGCIKALDSYFQLAQRSERHRLVSLQYSQINGLTEVVINKPENYVVKADLVARSRKQSHDVVDIPIDDIGAM